MEEKDILFIKDIAKLLDVSPNTLRRKRWRDKTGIPLHKVGKKLCCLRGELEKWLKNTKV